MPSNRKSIRGGWDRRNWMRAAAAAGASASAAGFARAAQIPPEALAPGGERPADRDSAFAIRAIERTTVRIPFRETPARSMARELPHWGYFEIFRVELRGGAVGFGETHLYYTWNATTDAAVERARDGNAPALMWDDSLGAGLQMALFDAVARGMGVPVHALLGRKIRERAPIAWWNIEMPPEDLGAEVALARKSGYRALKTKGRPWFDVDRQLDAAQTAVGDDEFTLGLDFNDCLLTAEQAIPRLLQWQTRDCFRIDETPIPETDVPGNQRIKRETRVPLAVHYGVLDPVEALKADYCDGFVMSAGARGTSGGASRLVRQAAVAEAGAKPFWLQLVGSGITAAFSLHFGATLPRAEWPAVNCHQLYEHDLLANPITVQNGAAPVPDAPGLGHEVDLDALARYRVEKPHARPDPRRLAVVRYADGETVAVANSGEVNYLLTWGQKGLFRYFEPGVDCRVVPDDGSRDFDRAWNEARRAPTRGRS